MSLTLDLSKSLELSLVKAAVVQVPRLEVRLAVDESGSMQEEYRDGLVDAMINRFIVAAMKFDDNQRLDIAFFSHYIRPAPEAVPGDVGSYLARKFPKRDWGGTSYAPIIEHFETKVAEKEKKGFFGLLGGKQASGTAPMRGYCAVITDGDNTDKPDFEKLLSNSSGDTFFEFIAIGTQIRTEYLTAIANRYNHVSFTHVADPKRISDQDFYDKLVNPKFVAWIGQ